MNPTGLWPDIFMNIQTSEQANNRIYQGVNVYSSIVARGKRDGPKWIEVSDSDPQRESLGPGQDYHDLGSSYPDAPVPRITGDTVIRRADLEDLTGVSELMDWVSDGDIVIVKMGKIINNDLELNVAVNKIQRFVEDDISGEVLRLGERRLLLLPPNFTSRTEK